MHILITNDDGINAKGIQILAQVASFFGEVTVVAPYQESSAISHAITLHRPLRVRKPRPSWFSVDGTPIDCVYVALHHLCKDNPPDLLLSGVNHGANLGYDTHYSGTVSAAMEGVHNAVTSFAFSVNTSQPTEQHWDYVRIAVREVLDWFFEREKQLSNQLFNVNFPLVPSTTPSVIKVTTLGHVQREPQVMELHGPRDELLCWIGGVKTHYTNEENHDCQVVQDGEISITPLSIDSSMKLLFKKEDKKE